MAKPRGKRDASVRVTRALGSFCASSIEELIDDERPDDLEALKTIGADASSPYRLAALHALARTGDRSVDTQLAKLLPRLDESDRSLAIDALGLAGTPTALEAITNQLNDESPRVRKSALYALSRFDGSKARAAVVKASKNDPQVHLRRLARKLATSRPT